MQEYWSGLPCPPPGDLPNPGIEPMSLFPAAFAGRLFTASTTWGSPYAYVYVCAQSLSRVQLFSIPWTVAHQAPLSIEFLGKNTGVGCHFLFQGIFPPRD